MSPAARYAVADDLVEQGLRRRLVDLEHETGVLRDVAIAELSEELLLRRERPRGSGAERVECLLAFADRQRPARKLAAEAREHGVARVHLHAPWPVRGRHVGGELDVTEPAHADLGDAQSRLDAADLPDTGVHDDRAGGGAIDAGAHARGRVHELRDERRDVVVEAEARCEREDSRGRG